MFMPKKTRIAIYTYLFKEGVITVQKDPRLLKHHLLDVVNVHVLDALRSLKSRGYVREVFNWQWFYYFLTDEGINYLRQYLYLDENVVPDTLKKPVGKASGVREGAERSFGGRGRGGFGGEKGVGPAGEFRPRFGGERAAGGYRREGGFGRGGAPAEGAAPAPASA